MTQLAGHPGSALHDPPGLDDPATQRPLFTEKQVTFANNLSYDGKLKNLTVTSLDLNMPSSNAAWWVTTKMVLP